MTRIFFFMVTFISFPLWAQHDERDHAWMQKMIDPSPLVYDDSLLWEFYLLERSPNVKIHDLLQHNIEVVRILNEKFLVVKATPLQMKASTGMWMTYKPVPALWKLSDPLLLSDTTDGFFIVKTRSVPDVIKAISTLPTIRLVHADRNYLVVDGAYRSVINHLPALDPVEYIGRESLEPQTESIVRDMNLHVNAVNRIHHQFPELNGEGMVLSIRELRYDPNDIDLRGRDIPSPLAADEISNHATDMATIAAGAGNSFITGKGAAWAAGITSSGFGNMFLPDEDIYYQSMGIGVQNHSYGTLIENFYGALAEAYDLSANRLPHLLHVFSSGNQGADTGTGPYHGVKGFANLTGNFKMAKNALVIGSVDTTGNPIRFVSRGPAYDGRIKPELVAYSTQGSSNSAALVSGIVVLLQQAYFREEGSLPPSALLKALLINSANDAGQPGIDYVTGYGSVDAYRTLINLREKRYFSGQVSHGESLSFPLVVPTGASHLKVTLVWNDPAALPNAGKALVNDLDLTVENENGETWLPWVLDASPDSSALVRPTVRGDDHLNNVEQVTLAFLQGNAYTITVKGYDVPHSPQSFFIAYQWDEPAVFEWSFPTGSDNIPYDGETATCFFWHTSLPESIGKLEYSIDDGLTWMTIADDVDLQKGFYRWNNIPFITARAYARMTVGDKRYITEPFTISRSPEVAVGFHCADSVRIHWPSMTGVGEYRIYTLTGAHLEPFMSTQDTAVVLHGHELDSRWYAVQPVLNDGVTTLRSYTFDYEKLGFGCYLLSFYDEVLPPKGIYLNAFLGTVYGIQEIVFEHDHGGFEPIGSITQPVTTGLRFLHEQPHQGWNRYRMRIRFVNGEEMLSDSIEAFFLTEAPYAVFPNPVTSPGFLQVFSKQWDVSGGIFRLFRADGTLVISTKLTSDLEFIPIDGLVPGLFLYSIISPEGNFSGKILVR